MHAMDVFSKAHPTVPQSIATPRGVELLRRYSRDHKQPDEGVFFVILLVPFVREHRDFLVFYLNLVLCPHLDCLILTEKEQLLKR